VARVTYELVDMVSFNLVGSYPNQDVVLLAVLETARVSGEHAAETLSLATDDPASETGGELIAQGPELVRKARVRWQSEQPTAVAV
jgi:hypothetical protein